MGFLYELECNCMKISSGTLAASGSVFRPNFICAEGALIASLSGTATLTADNQRLRTTSVSMSGVSTVESFLSGDLASMVFDASGVASLEEGLTVDYGASHTVVGSGSTQATTDKIAGTFDDFNCLQKLYPTADISVTGNAFIRSDAATSGLYDYINEGVFTGDIDSNGEISTIIADDKGTYIHPSSIAIDDVFEYKCEVTKPTISPEDSNLHIRLSAPLASHESIIPPSYIFTEIKLEDPSGGLIVQYEDFTVRGDADHTDSDYVNFVTYSLAPTTNNALLRDWHDDYPLMQEASGYSLSFTMSTTSPDDAFDGGFSLGFEDHPQVVDSGQARLGVRISAIEICNSGGIGPDIDNYLGLYGQVRESGNRLERSIYPIAMPLQSFDTGIYPSVSSIWYANSLPNTTLAGTEQAVKNLRTNRHDEFILLDSMGPLADSGKLTVTMGHRSDDTYSEVTPGSFWCGFDQETCSTWNSPSGAFNTENKAAIESLDSFFVVESVTLKVLAKKASGSRDYSLDVVGYSDDKLLNITSAVGGFLQNVSGVGTLPVSSGFNTTDELGLDGEAISDKSQYFQVSGTNNAGGDHYLLSTVPLVTATDFTWYEIPLKVYEDDVELGQSRDYTMSSMFEKLNLDIFPLPSGAAIANMHLLVQYRPQTALKVFTTGGEQIGVIDSGRDEGKIYPSIRQTSDDIINAGSGYAPLSTIEGIPQAYTTPTTIKSNYSRRWRGMEGTVQGPFDPDMFSFGFDNPLLDFPFLSGFYDFDYNQGLNVIPRVGTLSGTITTNYSEYQFKNVGWRFQNQDLFTDQLPGYSGAYQTTDWSSLASGATNFQSHPLYGQIADAFNNVVRISGHNSYIDFGDIDVSGEFSLYTRFSPDSNVSGVGYDLFNSGVLLSKWDSGSDLEFALGYESGYLCGFARDTLGNLQKVTDTTSYTDYQFPLSVILTYNDHDSSGLKLYTDNEFETNWTTLRASSVAPFNLNVGDSDFIVGHSSGSGVGMNMFVSELGISNTANIVYANPDLTYKEVTAQKFLENNRVYWWDQSEASTSDDYKLWDYVNEDTQDDWVMGDFQTKNFSPAFSHLTKRTGRDLISFNMVHSGLSYSQTNDLSLPSTIDSGVAYHTQIENDFLRFNLSDASDNFYSTARRITKDLPRGYQFAEEALVVDTIIDHTTDSTILWDDGSIGPKLIVSLYTKNQDPYWTPDQPNWGLINRYTHYLAPSSCLIKLKSVFDYDSLTDTSESWSVFPSEPRVSDFKEKFFSQDIDDMFLQYDLVYPSGGAFTSRLNVHSSHVRLDRAFVSATTNSGILGLRASGNPSPVSGTLNLFTGNAITVSGNTFNLYTVGPLQVGSSGMNIYTSGMFVSADSIPMFAQGHQSTYIVPSSGFNIVSSGGPAVTAADASGTMNISALGKGIITSSGGSYLGMAITALNSDTANIPDGTSLSLFAYGGSGADTIISSLPILAYSDPESNGDTTKGNASGTFNLTTLASNALVTKRPVASMNLFTLSNTPTESLNITAYADGNDTTSVTGAMNMFTANYSVLGTGATYMQWFNNNYGTDINLEDNEYATIPTSDNIRGVDLIGYGSCTGDSPQKAVDPAIVTHDTTWRPETCNDGGIFRAYNTYTNASGSYSGNYYDIRKYDGLVPQGAYYTEIKISTGSTDSIPTPPEWEEWEYGTNATINYSGAKLIGSQPSGRNLEDKYGTKVAVKGDLMAVGSPFMDTPDESGTPMTNAGSVFVYRRGDDVAGEKADWNLEEQINLPDEYRGDYSVDVGEIVSYDGVGSISGQKWNIGQEGRELGHALDVAQSGNREVVVVGAPGASWSRSFPTIETSGIPVAMMLFVDVFDYDASEAVKVANATQQYDLLYKYFSAPWASVSGNYQPQIDLKLIICQCVDSDEDKPALPKFDQDWIHHKYIGKLNDSSIPSDTSTEWYEMRDNMFSGVQEAFFEAFPRNTAQLHNNIPPIISIFQDSSNSLNGAFGSFTEATEEAVDKFEQFYKDYSFASGVEDKVLNVPNSGYIERTVGDAEDWTIEAQTLINTTLSTGNLSTVGALKFITSGIGQEWAQTNAYEFQIHPASGGRVYVFEKEGSSFNLIQEIKSPQEALYETFNLGDYDQSINDRFGHSVSISDNTDVIAVGSPFSTSACQIYERDAAQEARLFNGLQSWLTYRGFTSEAADVDSLGSQAVYDALSTTNKFYFRSDELFWADNNGIPTPYSNIYDYSYSSIPYTGTWQFLPGEFAGTSRLGYSTAVSEDGDVVAFGAPTDSFNEFDDTNVWYKTEDTWASYSNAGAVRVFEARKYYPHDLAVEFYRFGNLDKNTNIANAQYYNHMSGVFSVDDVPFRRMAFDEIEIPQEAGLAFIITPELDSASDEIVDNIKNWLALGDRTLVLVGNDPEFEEDGKYRSSNEILHTLLGKLDSRMRIHAARNEYESLQYCADTTNSKYNVTTSFVPSNAHSTYITPRDIYASGVGDIRISLDPQLYIEAPCDDINVKCEMPIEHNGDLRAQWHAECTKTVGKQKVVVKYDENLPFHFANETASQGCDTPPSQLIDRTDQEPRPILTAAEWLPETTQIIPASSGWVSQGCTSYTVDKTSSSTIYEFNSNQNDEIAFSISGVSSTVDGVGGSGLRSYTYDGGFTNPDAVDDRDGVLQAVGTSYFLPPVAKTNTLASNASLVSEETTGSNKVVLIASLLPENATSMEGKEPNSDDPNTNYNNDQNIFFYANLLTQSCSNAAVVKQLGGWTGRTSFADAYSKSELLNRLSGLSGGLRPSIEENYATLSLNSGADIIWIADPTSRPSTAEMNHIKSWLALGNKKVVITYSNTIANVRNVTYLCDELGLNSKPFVDRDGDYITQTTDKIKDSNLLPCCPYTEAAIQNLDTSNSIVQGCTNSFGKSTELTKLMVAGNYDSGLDATEQYPYVPINIGANTDSVIYYVDPVNETYEETDVAWEILGDADITFDVLPGSGYRLFYEWVSEKEQERYALAMNVQGVSTNPSPEGTNEGLSSSSLSLSTTSSEIAENGSLDIKVPANVSGVTINFNANRWRNVDKSNTIPYTPRLLSISGCLLPIDSRVVLSTTAVLDPSISPNPVCSGYWQPIPEKTITIPAQFRPILTDNSKYCQGYPSTTDECSEKGNQLIQDGPVVVAEEQEHFSSFIAGSSRSRIVLISDSTIVQGACPTYRDDALAGNQAFIRSLYPPQPTTDYTFQTTVTTNSSARKFNHVQKLVAPERGSAAKYSAASGLPALTTRFGLGGVDGSLENYSDTENDFVPGDVTRPADPAPDAIKAQIDAFGSTVIPTYGVYPRFSGVYVDAGIGGGVPDILRITGSDHLDFNVYPSGYPGDLFGYSIGIHKNKLIVGAPFNGFDGSDVVSWSGVAVDSGSGLLLSGNGGAGGAFYFERTGSGVNAVASLLPWEFQQKLKPDSINIGIDEATTFQVTQERGSHFLNTDFVLQYASVTDKFGLDVSIDADFAAIGAPGHDFATLHDHIYSGSASFIRKEFSAEFDIPKHVSYDLGSSGVRVDDFGNASGVFVMNNGAVFTYHHKMVDWANRTKQWIIAEKVLPQGYNSHVQQGPLLPSGTENDRFGETVSINRARRGDGDYTLAIGAPCHSYATSGAYSGVQPLRCAGAAYVYDAMLREQVPTIPNSGSYIDAQVFGDKTDDNLSLLVFQNTAGGSQEYIASGLVFANPSGAIFLEGSGFDPSTKGFVAHRPYVTMVVGSLAVGVATTGYLGLNVEGKAVDNSGQLNLSIAGASSASVYNTMNINTTSWNTIEVGSGTTPFSLVTSGAAITNSSGILSLSTSGISTVSNSDTPFNLRTRGK